MNLIKTSIFIVFIAINSINVNAQKQVNLTSKKTNEETSNKGSSVRSPQFTTTSVNNQSEIVKQSLLQELYSIEDQRNIIEKNNALSSSDRNLLIQENNKKYTEKRIEFINFIESKGIVNVTKQEQSFYLNCLKQDNRIDDYNKGINLIKNSQK